MVRTLVPLAAAEFCVAGSSLSFIKYYHGQFGLFTNKAAVDIGKFVWM